MRWSYGIVAADYRTMVRIVVVPPTRLEVIKARLKRVGSAAGYAVVQAVLMGIGMGAFAFTLASLVQVFQ
jgi:hypothetical protein